MFVYNLYYGCRHSGLLYPSVNHISIVGNYKDVSHGKCSMLFIELIERDGSFQLDIDDLEKWIESLCKNSNPIPGF